MFPQQPHDLRHSPVLLRPRNAGRVAAAGTRPTIDNTFLTRGRESHMAEPTTRQLCASVQGEPECPPLTGGTLTSVGVSPPSASATGTVPPWSGCRRVPGRVYPARHPNPWTGAVPSLPVHSKARAQVTSVACACPGLPAHAHTAHTRIRRWVTSGPGQAQMDCAEFQQHPTKGVTRPQVTTSGTATVAGNRGAGTPPVAAASEPIPFRLPETASTSLTFDGVGSEAAMGSAIRHRERSPLSPDNQLWMVGAALVDRSRPGPTVAPDRHCEFSRVKGVCPRMTNTSRMTARHLDTMDELLDCIEAFVKAGKITTMDELDLLRKARQASDEAQLLDYAYALQMCAMKENGIWGQRFHQLAREAEAFRAGMVEREEAADDVHRQAA